MKIAVDAMGGDHAPAVAVEGAVQAAVEDGAPVVLVGDRERIDAELGRLGARGHGLEIVHAEEVVGMDEPAITPIRRKRRSSIRLCAELVAAGDAQAMVTAGNTGAAMAASMLVMGTLEGVDRPALAAVVPNPAGRTVLLDVGANVGTKPKHLRQFAVMGHFYALDVLGTPTPRIGLMSVGEEEGKGTDLTREVYEVLQQTGLNFVGNVEGRDVFNGEADVVVCDGFVGNVMLKACESLATLMGDMMKRELEASWRTKLGAFLALPALRSVRRNTDPNEYGAAPLLGVRGGCFIGHGSSSALGIRSSVRRAVEFCTAEVHVKIGERVAVMRRSEQDLIQREEEAEAS